MDKEAQPKECTLPVFLRDLPVFRHTCKEYEEK
jgi:hypothetical protein